MGSKFYFNKFRFGIYKITILCFTMFLGLNLKAQFYSFLKTTATYTEITGGTTLINGNWNDFSVKFKTPFTFRYFTSNIFDSIEVTDGGIFFNNINNGLFDVYTVDLNSRGNGKSEVSYKTEGTTPNRIIKIQFHNAGFLADAPNFNDSVNFQLWIYETTYVLEFRYGSNSVKSSSYNGDTGPVVQIADPLSPPSNFMTLEGDPGNPTLRTSNFASRMALTGSPANGTLYRFTPSTFHNGIQTNRIKINVTQNRIELPLGTEAQKIDIINMNGKVIQSSKGTEDLNFSNLDHGVYLISVQTKEGMITEKLIL